MKHCNFCNVDLEDKKVHCPLCGKCIDEESVKKGIVNHSDIYPDFKNNIDHIKLIICKKISNSLLIATLACIGIDLCVNKTMGYSLIVLMAYICLYYSVISPIRKNIPIETMFIFISIYATIFVVFIEFYTKTLGWGICYAVPGLFAGLSLVCIIFMLISKFNNTDMIKPIIINLLLDLVLLIVLLIVKKSILITVLSLLFNLCTILFILVFKFKTASKSITKEFRF